jgi:hypothetical protein
MSDDKARDIINRGDRARSLLEDDVFREACAKLEADLIKEWKARPVADQFGRERLWTGVNMLNKIVETLEHYATTGRHERRRIEELATGQPRTHLQSVA